MNKKRKHHYIPIGILKHFEVNGNLHVYSRLRNTYYPVTPKDAFTQNDLNRLRSVEGIDEFNGIEDIFDKGYESPAMGVFKRILDSFSKLPPNNNGLSNQDFHIIFNFIKISVFRPPHALKYFSSKTEANFYGKLLLKWYLEKGNFEFPDYVKMSDKVKFAFLRDQFKIIREFADLQLCVSVIEHESKEFLLSDSYMNMVTPNDNWFQDEELEIHFAITPKIALTFYRANPNVKSTVWHLINEIEIDKYNSLVIENSYDAIGCSSMEYLMEEIDKNKHLLSIKNRYHNKLDWKVFKEEVTHVIKRYTSESTIKGDHAVRLHVNDEFKFAMYSVEE